MTMNIALDLKYVFYEVEDKVYVCQRVQFQYILCMFIHIMGHSDTYK